MTDNKTRKLHNTYLCYTAQMTNNKTRKLHNTYLWILKVIETARFQDHITVHNLIKNYTQLYDLEENHMLVRHLIQQYETIKLKHLNKSII